MIIIVIIHRILLRLTTNPTTTTTTTATATTTTTNCSSSYYYCGACGTRGARARAALRRQRDASTLRKPAAWPARERGCFNSGPARRRRPRPGREILRRAIQGPSGPSGSREMPSWAMRRDGIFEGADRKLRVQGNLKNVFFCLIPEPCCTPLPCFCLGHNLKTKCQTTFSKLTLSGGPFQTSQKRPRGNPDSGSLRRGVQGLSAQRSVTAPCPGCGGRRGRAAGGRPPPPQPAAALAWRSSRARPCPRPSARWGRGNVGARNLRRPSWVPPQSIPLLEPYSEKRNGY